MSMLAADGGEYRARLLSMGLTISPSPKARQLLTMYIQTSMPEERICCVPRVGWHDGAFVLPDETFGIGERVLFQSAAGSEHRLRVAGTLADWQTQVARYCEGNPRLVFAGYSTLYKLYVVRPLVSENEEMEGSSVHEFLREFAREMRHSFFGAASS